ncbi:MAG: hypothetical protein RLZ12_94 [Bacillota bacterium]
MWNRCIVLGAARSGLAAAKFLSKLGTRVTVTDSCLAKFKEPSWEELRTQGVELLEEQSVLGKFSDYLFELVVKSPGISYNAPLIQAAIRRAIPIVTEVELAGRVSLAPILGITGTNGKTTTTILVGKLLQAAGYSTLVAGNIGQALLEVVPSLTEQDWLVAELSSFQLQGTIDFKPKVAACLNLSPAHLDYHGTLAEYQAAKAKLFANQTAEDFAVLNFDDSFCLNLGRNLKSPPYWFSAEREVPQGIWAANNSIWFKKGAQEPELLVTMDKLDNSVVHIGNLLVALLIVKLCGAQVTNLPEVLSHFQGPEHRLEYVRRYNGVDFYNDAKASNLAATSYALASSKAPIILIGGGLDRGDDFYALFQRFKEKIRWVCAFGESGKRMIADAKKAGIYKVDLVKDLEEAVFQVMKGARSEETVLFSPACASWDMFSSFEERGGMFKDLVHKF